MLNLDELDLDTNPIEKKVRGCSLDQLLLSANRNEFDRELNRESEFIHSISDEDFEVYRSTFERKLLLIKELLESFEGAKKERKKKKKGNDENEIK